MTWTSPEIIIFEKTAVSPRAVENKLLLITYSRVYL